MTDKLGEMEGREADIVATSLLRRDLPVVLAGRASEKLAEEIA